MEGLHEAQGLRFWNGDPTVYLLEADDGANAMLLEACDPGQSLKTRPEREQDVVIASVLKRVWRRPEGNFPFRSLATQTAYWSAETAMDRPRWPDAAQVEEGLRLFATLSQPSQNDVLLATDLHAENVLSATRRPWLAIDPKPFVGDCAYDGTQHLLNCRDRLRVDPHGTVRRFADHLEVDAERVRLWLVARLVAEPRDTWDGDSLILARSLS
jgi:streptomycin 6-kinase